MNLILLLSVASAGLAYEHESIIGPCLRGCVNRNTVATGNHDNIFNCVVSCNTLYYKCAPEGWVDGHPPSPVELEGSSYLPEVVNWDDADSLDSEESTKPSEAASVEPLSQSSSDSPSTLAATPLNSESASVSTTATSLPSDLVASTPVSSAALSSSEPLLSSISSATASNVDGLASASPSLASEYCLISSSAPIQSSSTPLTGSSLVASPTSVSSNPVSSAAPSTRFNRAAHHYSLFLEALFSSSVTSSVAQKTPSVSGTSSHSVATSSLSVTSGASSSSAVPSSSSKPLGNYRSTTSSSNGMPPQKHLLGLLVTLIIWISYNLI